MDGVFALLHAEECGCLVDHDLSVHLSCRIGRNHLDFTCSCVLMGVCCHIDHKSTILHFCLCSLRICSYPVRSSAVNLEFMFEIISERYDYLTALR